MAYLEEPWLERSVAACLASEGVEVEVVVVDNGCTDGAVDRLRAVRGVKVVDAHGNSGFAGGSNLGVTEASMPIVALVNPDAVVEPGALAAIAARATEQGVGIATGCVVLADRPELLNSAGNELHVSGVSWSGHFEEPVSEHAQVVDVLAASGCLCAMRREVWDELGGFDETFFAYYEDAQLSLRCWQRGWRVTYEPTAVVHHRYEFSRRPAKMELLERNRLQTVLTCFGPRLLLAALPVLVTFELGVVAMAAAQGWLPHKLRSWMWLLRNAPDVRRRRRVVQAARRAADRTYVHLFADDLLPGNLPPPAWFAPVNAAYRAWWRLVGPYV